MYTARDREYKREARAVAKEIGICRNCLKRLAVASFCGACLEKRAEWQARRKARWIAEGRCSRCGAEREDVDRRMCARCMVYMRKANRKRSEREAA